MERMSDTALSAGSLNGTIPVWSMRVREQIESARRAGSPESRAHALSMAAAWRLMAQGLLNGDNPLNPQARLAFEGRDHISQAVASSAFHAAHASVISDKFGMRADARTEYYDCMRHYRGKMRAKCERINDRSITNPGFQSLTT